MKTSMNRLFGNLKLSANIHKVRTVKLKDNLDQVEDMLDPTIPVMKLVSIFR